MASANGRTSADADAWRPSPEKARSPVPATVTTRGPVTAGAGSQPFAKASPARSTAPTTHTPTATARRFGKRGSTRPRAGGSARLPAGTLDAEAPLPVKLAVTQLAISRFVRP